MRGLQRTGRKRARLASDVTDVAGNALATGSVLNFFTLQGDANRDGRINTFDFNTLASNFNKTGMTLSKGDFNYDGKVNALDFNALATKFGSSIVPLPAPPFESALLNSAAGANLFADAQIDMRPLSDVLETA